MIDLKTPYEILNLGRSLFVLMLIGVLVLPLSSYVGADTEPGYSTSMFEIDRAQGQVDEGLRQVTCVHCVVGLSTNVSDITANVGTNSYAPILTLFRNNLLWSSLFKPPKGNSFR